jgi:hypothetical protein
MLCPAVCAGGIGVSDVTVEIFGPDLFFTRAKQYLSDSHIAQEFVQSRKRRSSSHPPRSIRGSDPASVGGGTCENNVPKNFALTDSHIPDLTGRFSRIRPTNTSETPFSGRRGVAVTRAGGGYATAIGPIRAIWPASSASSCAACRRGRPNRFATRHRRQPSRRRNHRSIPVFMRRYVQYARSGDDSRMLTNCGG